MVSYALQTIDDRKVRDWFFRLDKKLRTVQGVMISGASRHLGQGCYVVNVEPVVSIYAFLVGPFMLLLGAVLSYVLGGVGLSNWLAWIAVFLLLVPYFLLSPGFHRILVWITLWRLLGRPVRVSRASDMVLGRLSRGRL